MTKSHRPLLAVLGLLMLGACAPNIDYAMPGERLGQYEGVDYRDIGR